jgi:hypothetical protein
MTQRKNFILALMMTVLCIGAQTAHAQWVMVARAVAGRVETMSNRSKDGNGYDVATVVLEANADKVYQTAIARLKTHPDITITKQDAKTRTVSFSKGAQVASLKATPLGDKVTQLLVAATISGDQAMPSNLPGSPPGPASMVVDGILNVCKDMEVECTVQSQ